MDVVIALLLAVLLIAVVVVGLGIRTLLRQHTSPAIAEPGTDLVRAGEQLPAVTTHRADHGQLELRIGDQLLAVVSDDPDPSDQRPAVQPANLSIVAAFTEIARATPEVFEAVRGAGLRLTFSRETMKRLVDGSLTFMGGSRAVAVDPATARIVEVGRVTGSGLGRMAAAWPVILSGGVAAASAALQQQQLGSLIDELDQGLDHLYQRQIDDDSGTLHAAARLAVDVIRATQDGDVPAQIQRELAVARRAVDGIYFARREQIRRFIAKIERAQNEHEAQTDESKAWAKGVAEAFGDPDQFQADALSYIRAAAIRGHLAAGTAAVVAVDGRPDYAFGLLSRNEDLLREDVLDLSRRLNSLTATTPDTKWYSSGGREAYDVCIRLTAELDRRIEPLLSLDRVDTISVELDPLRFAGELPPGGPESFGVHPRVAAVDEVPVERRR